MTTINELEEKLNLLNVSVRGWAKRVTTGESNMLLVWTNGSDEVQFGTGWFDNEQDSIDFTYLAMPESEDELMNILKNDKLFPNIRGVMLKDKPVVLTLSGKFNITELQGGDARCEVFFSDHSKTAVVNRNQILNIIEMYGPETSEWKGRKVELYGEQGVWFGKKQWGIRISNQIPKNGKPKAAPKTEPYEVKPFDKSPDELPTDAETIPFDLGDDPVEYE